MTFCWCTIMVSDMDRSLSFYKDLVGLKLNRRFTSRPGVEIVFLGEETQVELIHDVTKTDFVHSNDISLGFETDSLDNTKELMESSGYSIYSGPIKPNEYIQFFYVKDPNGVKVQFVEHLK